MLHRRARDGKLYMVFLGYFLLPTAYQLLRRYDRSSSELRACERRGLFMRTFAAQRWVRLSTTLARGLVLGWAVEGFLRSRAGESRE
jgi:hypothetical protein